ncbi:MAG: hypothetical protein ACRDS9_10645, partial [Pseudonocardiaceae bacterium]
MTYELTEGDREALFTAGDHHPDQCDCTAFADEVGYVPGSEICDGLDDTYRVVERIVAARMARAWDAGFENGIDDGFIADNPHRDAPT